MATPLWKYLNPGAYRRRFPLISHWLSVSLRAMQQARPLSEVTTKKYEGEFERIWSEHFARLPMSLTKDEFYTLYSSVRATRGLPGDIAELGVYTGNSARLFCELKGDRELFLFDTFEGMPDAKIGGADTWPAGTHTDTSLDSVRRRLSAFPGVHFIPGVFPESLEAHAELEPSRREFCFVHLDVDLYESTLAGLEFFYPRLVPSGRLVSHNYNLSTIGGGDTPGVKAAFMDYFEGRESLVVELADTQCIVVKAPEATVVSPSPEEAEQLVS